MAKKHSAEPLEMQIGQDHARDMPVDGDARIDEPLIEPVESANWEKIGELAFMEEPVTIMVHQSNDKNAEPFPEVGVNGRRQFFIRGEKQVVKRKFVGALARAKQTSFTQQYAKDANGNDTIRNIPSTALRFPFSVLHDPNPRGVEWLRKTLAEA